jgi:hypothetical protein
LIIGAVCWAIFGAFTFQPAIHRNSTNALIYDGYVSVEIDRTRTTFCTSSPSRIIYKLADVQGQDLPIVLPTSSQALVWPELGRQKFVLLLAPLADIPPGVWQIKESQLDDCGGWAWLTGGREVITTSNEITVP